MDFSHINFYALSGLINFFVCSIFGIFVLLQDRKNQANIGFAVFSLSCAVWSLPYFFWMQAVERDLAFALTHVLMIGTIFISVGFFHFILGMLGIYDRYKTILKWSYALFFVFLVLDFTPWFIVDVFPIMDFLYWPKPGIAFHFFLASWMFYFVWGTILLLSHYKKADRIKKAQIRYVLIGTSIAYVAGSSNWLPWYGIALPPITVGVSFYAIMVGYAALKHHLFNAKIIAVELLTFVIWGVSLIKILTAGQSGQVLIGDIALFLSVFVIGIFLIRSGMREEKQKELLDDLNQNLQKKVDEQTKEIRQAYEVERKARTELQELDKAKNEFILASQHNLRTPLTITKGFVDEIGVHTEPLKNAELKTFVDKTKNSLDILAQLINGLIDVTDLKVGKEGFSKKE